LLILHRFYKLFLKYGFQSGPLIHTKCVVFLMKNQGIQKPVLSWNGKRGRCKRSSTRATARNKYARALQQRRRTINTTRGLRATKCNLSSIVNKGIGWGGGGGSPQGGPRPGWDSGGSRAQGALGCSCGGYSGSADSCGLLRIAADYCGLLRIAADYYG
jgi:hypothetical protein